MLARRLLVLQYQINRKGVYKMVCNELLVLMGIGAVLPYMAEASLSWVKKRAAH